MSDLLKSAIADAKAVRATALANAKAALEEAFAPKLQSMLATKLQQEVDDEGGDELPDENPAPIDAPVGGDLGGAEEVPVADAPVPAPDAGLGGDLDTDMGAGGEVGFDAAPVDAAPAPDAACAPAEDPAMMAAPEPDGDEELPVDEFSMEEDTATSPGTAAGGNPTPGYNLAEEKASSNYKKTASGAHKTEDPQGTKVTKKTIANTAGAPAGKTTSGKASSNYKTMPKGNQVKNIKSSGTEDPQGAGKECTNGPGKADKNETGKVLEEDDVSEETLDEILRELEAEVNDTGVASEPQFGDAAPQSAPAPQGGMEMEEEIDLSALLESDDDDKDDEKEEKEEDGDDDDDDKDDKKKNLPPWLQKENISLKKELQEYRSTVQYLRDRINEVNLLNAKLLYTNKLFKQAQLTNEQKLKVIEQFDLTKSVREAKLTYANLSESLSFGVRKAVSAPAPVARKSGIVKTITEGLASKSIASTKPTKAVITEGAEMAARFKKLAGIRSK